MLKKAIRDMYLQKRVNLTDEVWREFSDSLIANFSEFDLAPVDHLLSYYPLSERKEFDISQCVPVVKSKWPQVKVGWPRIEPDMKSMEVYKVEEDGLYAKNKFNILEPINGEWIAPKRSTLFLFQWLLLIVRDSGLDMEKVFMIAIFPAANQI